MSVMPFCIAMLLTSKIGFAATDAVTGLKLVEKGVPKVNGLDFSSGLNSNSSFIGAS